MRGWSASYPRGVVFRVLAAELPALRDQPVHDPAQLATPLLSSAIASRIDASRGELAS